MPQVKNLKVTELGFSSLVAHYTKVAPDEVAEIKKLLPRPTNRLEYDLLDANTPLANSWRIIILDELEMPRMTSSIGRIITDDITVRSITDYVVNRLELIPRSYMPNNAENEKIELKIDVHNTSETSMLVTSKDIVGVGDIKGFQWDTDIDIIMLSSGKKFSMPIKLDWGTGAKNATFSQAIAPIYMPLNYDEAKMPRSETQLVSDYHLGVKLENLISPMEFTIMGWQTLAAKLESAISRINVFMEVGSGFMPYIHANLKVFKADGNIVVYEFSNETYSLTNVLSWYAYILDPDIDFVQAAHAHPEDVDGQIRIIHSSPSNHIIAAARAALKDVNSIISQLEKYGDKASKPVKGGEKTDEVNSVVDTMRVLKVE